MRLNKKKSGGGGGANWMDTYGDLVTLLLCFFVLLYSMSSIDQDKWKMIVQSFNSTAIESKDEAPSGPEGDTGEEGGDAMPMTQDDVNNAMDDLYEFLMDYAQNQLDSTSASVSRGDGYVFISFNDAIFFDGDSYALRQDGKDALNGIIPALSAAGPYIDELRVLGHTAQASANRENDPTADRFLASNRSTIVLLYLQENISKNELDPARLVGVQYGQWRPIAPNDTSDTRFQNRRVELIITGRDMENVFSDSIKQYYTMSDHTAPENSLSSSPEQTVEPTAQPAGTAPSVSE